VSRDSHYHGRVDNSGHNSPDLTSAWLAADRPHRRDTITQVIGAKIEYSPIQSDTTATPALAALPVVMLTGARMAGDDAHRAVLQPRGYFVKPLLLREYQPLVEELEQLLLTIPDNR